MGSPVMALFPQFIDLPDDIIKNVLLMLPLNELIYIRRVNLRMKTIVEMLLSSKRCITKEEMLSLTFDGREWLMNCSHLYMLQEVTLVTLELNEKLALHLAQTSPFLTKVTVDNACYNRCFEFIKTFLSEYRNFHPNLVPQLQVDNLLEMTDNLKNLVQTYPNWDLKLALTNSELCSWEDHLSKVETLTMQSEVTEFEVYLLSRLTNLKTVIIDKRSYPSLPALKDLLKRIDEVVLTRMHVKQYPVLLELLESNLKRLKIDLMFYHKNSYEVESFMSVLNHYLREAGSSLKCIHINNSHKTDSIEFVKLLTENNLKNVKFEAGPTSERFSFAKGELLLEFWGDSLARLLNNFPKANIIRITTHRNFNVLQWIKDVKTFCGQHLNHNITIDFKIDGLGDGGPTISILGSNFKLSIPKLVGMNFELSTRNVLFAYSLAERYQLTDLRNSSLNFMREFLEKKENLKYLKPPQVCEMFKSHLASQ